MRILETVLAILFFAVIWMGTLLFCRPAMPGVLVVFAVIGIEALTDHEHLVPRWWGVETLFLAFLGVVVLCASPQT